MTVDTPTPRPGDPDGTLRERAVYVGAFSLWVLAILIISGFAWIYRQYTRIRRRLR